MVNYTVRLYMHGHYISGERNLLITGFTVAIHVVMPGFLWRQEDKEQFKH